MASLMAVQLKEPQPGPLPGLLLVGYVEQAPGDWVPEYDSPPPPDRPSINTAEGWNALAERMAIHEN